MISNSVSPFKPSLSSALPVTPARIILADPASWRKVGDDLKRSPHRLHAAAAPTEKASTARTSIVFRMASLFVQVRQEA